MVHRISALEARELIANAEIDIVDVRETGEWMDGHLPGARHVPLAALRANPKDGLRKDGVMFVCAAGVRSQTAARVAEEFGLCTLYSLNGGTRSWANAGLPLVRD